MAEQVVADLLDRLEGARRALAGHDHVRVVAVERVVVVEVPEVPHPAVHAEQVERRGRDEVDGRRVRAEEPADLRDAPERGAGMRHAVLLLAVVRRSSTSIGRLSSQPVTPHQSRMNSASTCAVCTTDGRYTRSSTPWAPSAYGPKQTLGMPPCSPNVRASVVPGGRDQGRRGLRLAGERRRQRRHQRLVGGDRVALAGEAVVGDLRRVLGQVGVRVRRGRDGRLDPLAQGVHGLAGVERQPEPGAALAGHGGRPVAALDHADVQVDRVRIGVVGRRAHLVQLRLERPQGADHRHHRLDRVVARAPRPRRAPGRPRRGRRTTPRRPARW